MTFAYEFPLWLLLLVTAAGAILVKDLMSAILLSKRNMVFSTILYLRDLDGPQSPA